MEAWNVEILVEESYTDGLSSIAIRVKCLFTFQFCYVNFVWKTNEGEAESIIK